MATKLTSTANRDAGITLIELLVVVTVLSILAVGVSLTAFSSGKNAAQSDKEWFRIQFDTLRSVAIQGRSARGLSISEVGLSTARMKDGKWMTKPPARKWSGIVTIAGKGPRTALKTPDIIMMANGQSTAFDIIFSDRRSRPQRCSSDGWTGLTCAGE